MILDIKTARIVITLMLFGLAAALLYSARRTLTVFLFAILFSYLLDPAVVWVQHVSPFSKEKRVNCDGVVVEQVIDQLAVGVRHAAGDRVAAGFALGDRRRVRLKGPFNRFSSSSQI